MNAILLTTLNATYQHCAFGLRYLYANLGELQSQAAILEFTIQQKPRDIVEALLARQPRIVGLGVYIWNTSQTLEVVSLLKAVAPDVCVVLGGPEISYETEGQALFALADRILPGEADLRFAEFCRAHLSGAKLPAEKIGRGDLPEVKTLHLPYRYYSDEDIRNRLIYVEASRGCPYRCEFCLSSLDSAVRNFPLAEFLAEMESLMERGARQFKFVDRTFNLSPAISGEILKFFLARVDRGLFLHFEMVPDRLPEALRELIAQFPAGHLQFEIGVQTWNPQVAALVSRRQNYDKVVENFTFLREKCRVHIHADLIAGLPGETLESFAAGFDKLAALNPGEIQVGLLKRLKGTPIIRHDKEWEMVYQAFPPFTVLKNRTMDFATIGQMERFAKFWDLYANSGNFLTTLQLFQSHTQQAGGSWFQAFWEFARFLDKRHPQRYAIALVNLVESAWRYLSERLDRETVREALIEDYATRGRRDIPAFLRPESDLDMTAARGRRVWRHQRHLVT